MWAEIDSNPSAKEDVTLLIRPGVNFDEGERYIVALRNLKGEDGQTLAAPEGFRLYRDRVLTTNPDVESRREHFESLFGTLAEAGIDRDSLYRAWDFTVASERNLTERVLTIRDDAFAQLGDTNLADMKVEGEAPEFTIEEVDPEPGGPARAAGRGPVHGALLPEPAELHVGRHVLLPVRLHERAAGDPGGQHDDGAVPVQHSEVRDDPGRVTAVALRPRPARQPRRGEPGPAARLRPRAQLHLLRDRLGGDVVCRPAGHQREPGRDRELPREGAARPAPELRLPDRARDPRGHVELPAARRSRAAGADQLPLPRAPVDPSQTASRATRTSR